MTGEETQSVRAMTGGQSEAVRGVLGRGSVYSVATIVQLGAGLVTIPILTRVLDPAAYGVLTAALVAQAVLTNLAAFGIPPAISRAFFQRSGPEGARALIGATAIAAVLVGVLSLLTGSLWSQVFENVPFGSELKLAVVSAVASATLLATQVTLQAEQRVREYMIGAVIATAGSQGLGALWALLGGGAAGYLAGFTIGLYVAVAYSWHAAGIALAPLRHIEQAGPLLRTAFKIGLPTIPNGIALYLLAAGDRVLVERLEGLAAGGTYYIAYAVGSLGIFLCAALNGAWAPSLYGAAEGERWTFLADSALAILRVIALISAAFGLAAPLALAVLAPGEYDLAGLGAVSAFVAVSAVPYLWYLTGVNMVTWEGHTRVLALATPVAVTINLLLCAALIPPMGLTGAALATLVAYVLLGAITWVRARRVARVGWDAPALTLAAAPALAGLAAALLLPDEGVWLALRAVLAAAAALAAGRLLLSARRPVQIPDPATG